MKYSTIKFNQFFIVKITIKCFILVSYKWVVLKNIDFFRTTQDKKPVFLGIF